MCYFSITLKLIQRWTYIMINLRGFFPWEGFHISAPCQQWAKIYQIYTLWGTIHKKSDTSSFSEFDSIAIYVDNILSWFLWLLCDVILGWLLLWGTWHWLGVSLENLILNIGYWISILILNDPFNWMGWLLILFLGLPIAIFVFCSDFVFSMTTVFL